MSKWFEIWVDDSPEIPWVLILQGGENGNFQVIDPSKNYKVIFSAPDYETAKNWLLEDEFTRQGERIID